MLRNFLRNPDDRTSRAMVGILAGFIHLQPTEGWQTAEDIVKDNKRDFAQRHAVLRTLRFYYGFQPRESREQVLKCMASMLQQEDLMDIAVDQLRNWKLWNHTDTIIAFYQRPNNAPVTKRAILRYALTCPLPQAKKLIDDVRRTDPDLVNEIQESLQLGSLGNRSNKWAAGVWALCLVTGGLYLGRTVRRRVISTSAP
jgi:hypothetical protein